MSEPAKPTRYFGRIVLANLVLVVVLHVGRELINDNEGVFVWLFLLAFANLMLALPAFFSRQGQAGAAFLLSALLIGIAGFSDCATHLHFSSH